VNGTPRIVVLPGDGIGPEIVAAAREVLDALGEFSYDERLMGARKPLLFAAGASKDGATSSEPTVDLLAHLLALWFSRA